MGYLLNTIIKYSLKNYVQLYNPSDSLYLMISMYSISWAANHFSGGHEMPCVAFCFLIQPCFVFFLYQNVCAYTRECPQCILRSPEQSNKPSESTRTRAMVWQWNKDPRKWIQWSHTGIQKGNYRGRKQQNNQKGRGINLRASIREQSSNCEAGCFIKSGQKSM